MEPITVIEEIDEEKYRGQWLVIDEGTGKIVLSGATFSEAFEKAEAAGIPNAIFHRVPESNQHYAIVRE